MKPGPSRESWIGLCIAGCLIVGLALGGMSCKKDNAATSTCRQGYTSCNGQCTATQFDPTNCGACGTVCPTGQTCQSGACSAATCATGFSSCGSGCTDLKKDVNNCGVCGTACPSGERCSAGQCSGSCLAGASACPATGTPTYCANLQSDGQDCGACGKTCPLGQICTAGVCECGVDVISTATQTVCAQRSDHSILCRNAQNPVLGTGYFPAPLANVKTYAESVANVCALKSDGTVWCWGDNNYGLLGSNSSNSSVPPLQVKTNDDSPVGDMGAPPTTYLTGITQLSMGGTGGQSANGGSHACALDSSGQVWCWGRGGEGELGTGTSDSPFAIKATLTGPTQIIKVAAGDEHTCVLTHAGGVWCFGDNSHNQLGAGDGAAHTGAVQVMVQMTTPPADGGLDMGVATAPLGGIIDLATQSNHTCAVKSDHTLWCWGDNTYGQLGIGDTNPHLAAVEVMADANTAFAGAALAATGDYHSCATKTDGTAWCWGSNVNSRGSYGGPLGNNTKVDSSYPVQVLMAGTTPTPLTGVTSISAGHRITCAAVGATRKAYCWGINNSNQLGFPNVSEVDVATLLPVCAQ